jgi:hypothetical protein
MRAGLSYTFDRLYTKEQVKNNMVGDEQDGTETDGGCSSKRSRGKSLRIAIVYLAFVPVALFHKSHRKSYDSVDVKVTYALLGCTAAMELMAYFQLAFPFAASSTVYGFPWPDRVAQYNLVGYLARNRKHRWLRLLPACKDYLDHLWCMKPCESSRDITGLVHGYLQDGREGHMADAAAARAFNDSRGQRTLRSEGLSGPGGGKNLERSLRAPFDESVLLWHLATDFCFYGGDGTAPAPIPARPRGRLSQQGGVQLHGVPAVRQPRDADDRGQAQPVQGRVRGAQGHTTYRCWMRTRGSLHGITRHRARRRRRSSPRR